MTAIENINNEKTRLEAELYSKAEGQDATTIAKLQEQYNETFNNYAQKQLEPVSTKMNNAVECSRQGKGRYNSGGLFSSPLRWNRPHPGSCDQDGHKAPVILQSLFKMGHTL